MATGPGGILAVSTKWTSDHWDLADPTDEWLLAAARVAARNAERLAGPVRQVMPNPPIVPVVVCWGPQIDPIPAGASHVRLSRERYGDVLVVSGYQADDWLPLLALDRLDPDMVDRVDAVVAGWIDDYEERHRRNLEAREHAGRLLRWSDRLTGLTAVVTAAVTSSWIASRLPVEADAPTAVRPRRDGQHRSPTGTPLRPGRRR